MPNLHIIPPRVPLTDPRTGGISREWYRFLFDQFLTVVNIAAAVDGGLRTIPGFDGEPGDDAYPIPGPRGQDGERGPMGFGMDGQDGEDAMFAFVQRSPASAPFAISVGASPFTYTALFDGSVIISGGGVTSVEFSRDSSSTFFDAGTFYAPLPLRAGDQLVVTYAAAPTMVFIPS